MQDFRSEATLKSYYHLDYIFIKDEPDEPEKPEEEIISNLLPTKAEENSVDWSPNRLKNRGPKRRFYHTKKLKDSILAEPQS